ncbi:MAG TPA: PAS domain-containing protein [Baekduia sp.]|uniref:PAS domain-containing protein n=1 Tax=Baekduia sp. TaxID=2600305 RepID=UPI002B542B77|nr:PAS domain-containing protein [Baekduia sp.]HMJ36833.1 PAS domain-containing protein [Baekduia sp.]
MSHHTERFFELSAELLVIVGPDGRMQRVNAAWTRVLGYRAEELLGAPIADFQHPDDVARTAQELGVVLSGRPSPEFENRYRHKDGHYVWLRWSSTADVEARLIYGAARDVTEHVATSAQARRAVQRLEEAQRVAHIGSWEVDLRTGERFYTPEMHALQAIDPAVDKPWGLDDVLARVVPEHHARFRKAVRRMYAEPGTQQVEYRMHTPSDRMIRTLMEAVRDADGTPILVRGTTQDVTELRENERRLAEAEELAGMGSFEWRMSDQRLLWSPGTYRLYGRDPGGPPVGRGEFYRLMLPEEAARIQTVMAAAIAGLSAFEFVYTLPAPDGTRIELVGRGEAFRAGEETFVRGTVQDVTRHRRATRQQEEIARLGQMALGGTDLRELFDEVCRVVIASLDTTMTSVLALQPDGSFAFAASVGFDKSTGIAIPAGRESIARAALTAQTPLIVRDWLTETRFPYSPQLSRNGVRCTAVLPIRGHDGPFGVLATHSVTPGLLDAEQSYAFLEALATFLATAIERLRHEAEIAGLASLRGRLVAENIEAEERARQRISEELHDGALQDLLAARQDLVEAAGPDPATRQEMLDYARQGVERAVERLREAVHALHPVVLQHGGLEAAVQAAADQAARQGGFLPAVSVDAAAAGLRDELVMSLARELLTNAAKHARADVVHVAVRRDDGAVVLEVSDDGVGLDEEAVTAAPLNGHIGLASLAQRVEAVGGTLDLQAGDGHGTTVRARLPIG